MRLGIGNRKLRRGAPVVGTIEYIKGLPLLLFFFISHSFASFTGDVQSEIFKYASDQSPTFYFSTNSQFRTGGFLGQLKGYYESGPQGAWSFDPNPIKYSIEVNDMHDEFWFGREHPMQPIRETPIDPFTALGNVWVQNNINALNPSVDGWIGAGFIKNIGSDWKISACYSPLFIPTFGPSLGINDRGQLNPSRFAQLPPDQVDINGNRYSLRYKIETGQISEILLQNQVFLGTAFDNKEFHADVYAYTAPNPNPVVSHTDKLAIQSSTVVVQATVTPTFPRQYWAGTQIQAKEFLFQPSLEFVQNLEVLGLHYLSATGYVPVNPRMRAAFGLLTHLGHKFNTPQLSDWLVFLLVPFAITDELDFRTLLETTLLSKQQSFYWYNQVEYHLTRMFSIIGEIRILSGQDASFFGEWRSQDSYSMGIKWLW